jgi:SAM-dependent methyltransferase
MQLRLVTEDGEFPYDQADQECVPCNLCGRANYEIIDRADRNGLPVISVMCRYCGLMFVCPRMTAEWYSEYYRVEYRRQMAAFRGRKPQAADMSAMHHAQRRHGLAIARYLRSHGISQVGRALEIGSSAGGILCALRDELGAQVTGVEPSPAEAEFARARGVETHVELFERLELAPRQFDLIVCTQSFNHFLNPRLVAEKARQLLAPGGWFFLECQNFLHLCQYWGDRTRAIQIDHVYMFVPTTLEEMVATAGFDLHPGTLESDSELSMRDRQQRRQMGLPCLHSRLLARPSVQAPRAVRPLYESVSAELADLHLSRTGSWLKRKWDGWQLRAAQFQLGQRRAA